ncbi:MAG: gamma-glutamyl-gamma-aminobutyrate hydrolase family protein [Thermomicrobiales bacterium]
MKPVIGITPSVSIDQLSHGTFERLNLSRNYVEAVAAAGAIPMILPLQDDHAAPLLDLVDGVILSGGADVEPALYGDTDVHPTTYGVSPLRDRFEIELVHAAIERDLPLLCICRGIQVLNVALGGTLIQDVADQYGRTITHRQQADGIDPSEPGHGVQTEPGGHLERIFETADIPVNSLHHQAIRDLAPGLRIEGRAADGLIEAVSLPTASFVVGLQWHPEGMFQQHELQHRPFVALIEAARARRLIDASA